MSTTKSVWNFHVSISVISRVIVNYEGLSTGCTFIAVNLWLVQLNILGCKTDTRYIYSAEINKIQNKKHVNRSAWFFWPYFLLFQVRFWQHCCRAIHWLTKEKKSHLNTCIS